MAATITNLASGSDANFSPITVRTGATVTAQSGDWLVAIVATENNSSDGSSSSFSSMSNAQGNVTWTTRVDATYDPSLQWDGASLIIATGEVTGTITNDRVTAGFSDSVFVGAIQVYRVRPGSGETVSHISSASAGGSATTSHSAGTVSVTNGDIIFGAASIETDDTVTGDSDTTNGSWSAIANVLGDAGADAAAQTSSSQYKTVSATGDQTWTATTTASRDSKTGYLILRSATAALIVEALSGSYTVTGTAASPLHGWKTTASGGSYAVTGTDAEFDFGVRLDVDSGSYAVTGTAASLEHGYKPVAGAGSYTVTGTDATPSISSDKSIVAAAGSYLVTGKSANIQLFTEAEVASGSMPLKYYAPRVHCYVEVTPVIQAAAYSANDIVFVATEVENATWRSTPGGEEMFVESIGILDEANNTAANWTFYFARSTFTLGSINGSVSVSDADARVITSVYTMASTKFFDLANSKFGYEGGLKLSVIPTSGSPQSKSVWVAATTAGTPTYGTTSDIKLKLHFVS